MSNYEISRLTEQELVEFREFCELHWGDRHPLIHNDEVFRYYYCRGDKINFLRARDTETGELLSVIGFIPSNGLASPDVWISYVLSKKGAPLNLGFHMVEKVCEITNCRALGVNNVRKKVRGLYEFLGYSLVPFSHYYRLNGNKTDYSLCIPKERVIAPVFKSDAEFFRINDEKELSCFDFENYAQFTPFKDFDYFKHRFFENPWIKYEVFGMLKDGVVLALCVLRVLEHEGACVLRLVGFVGAREEFACVGGLLDRLIKERNADFADVYVYGIGEEALNKAGFVLRKERDESIIPDYLTPPLFENVDFYSVVDDTEKYLMFRADGDQDRPNMEA